MTGVAIPLELAAVLGACLAALGVWAGQALARHRPDCHGNAAPDPLGDLMKPVALSQAIDLAARRNAIRRKPQAVLHGQIDQLAMLHNSMNRDARDQVRAHVAAVMRAGLRHGDRVALHAVQSGREGAGERAGGFTIFIPGADEGAGVRIANRLRRKLAQLRVPQVGNETRLTARFGVAADHFGEKAEMVDNRARRALDAAKAQDDNHVVPASEIEEILFLPAPTSSPAASVA